jgi:demethylmenaquinone methyltransferase/2-methoxy-6-polyprenyl-1,4-benzoquinol methylase
MSTSNTQELTPPYFRLLVRLIRFFPNFDLWFLKPLRHRATGLLELKPGDRVLDGGCGPGASFPFLVDAVGESGEVVGVEISPEVAINARKRIDARKWTNVKLVVGSAETVALTGVFQGMTFLGAPDCYGSPQVLDNLLPHLAENGRVVIFGAKFSRRPVVRVLNSVLAKAFSKATFASTPSLDFQPWAVLEQRLGTFEVQEYLFGIFFLAWGPCAGARRM